MIVWGSVTTNLDAALQGLRESLAVREDLLNFALNENGYIFPHLTSESQKKFSAILAKTGADSSLLYRGLYVEIYFCFERFFREFVSKIVEHISSNLELKNKLDNTFKNRYISFYGSILAEKKQGNIHGVQYDFDKGLSSISNVINDHSNFEYDGEVFTIFMGNCTADRIEKILSNFFINQLFNNEIGKQVPLQKFYDDTATGRVAKAAKKQIDEIIRKRNLIAHSRQGIAAISKNDIDDASSFLQAFAFSLIGVAEDALQN